MVSVLILSGFLRYLSSALRFHSLQSLFVLDYTPDFVTGDHPVVAALGVPVESLPFSFQFGFLSQLLQASLRLIDYHGDS